MLLFVRRCADACPVNLKKMFVPTSSDLARFLESCARFLAPLIALCIFFYVDGLAFARFCLSLAWMLKAPAPVAPLAPVAHPLAVVAASFDSVPVQILRRSVRGSHRMRRSELIGALCMVAY
jgi:hypothetical protein